MKIDGPSPPDPERRVVVEGKFFACQGERFLLKGVTYGPFAPDSNGETFGTTAQAERDLALIGELGANALRTYHVPPRWFLDLAQARGLRILVDIPWSKHLCVLDSAEAVMGAREAVRRAVGAVERHPAVMAFSVANEIPADIVRYCGWRGISGFVEELIELGRALHPRGLFTYANYPSTEFLNPRNSDFVTFNVYLHEPASYRAYVSRLQMIADRKPLVLGEVGMDSLRQGEDAVGRFLSWQISDGFRRGLAGLCVFSFTDAWHRGGGEVEDWAFGLTTRRREPKAAFAVVQRLFRKASLFDREHWPSVSVVVASYNGGETLPACLESLESLDYPDYEVILVDDGSTDDTPRICRDHPLVRTIRHDNRGLSAARNTGIAAARGEIVAFTDADCRVDRAWLRYLVNDLEESGAIGIGGHNLLPPDDSPVAAAVMAAPGGPVHVMLTDEEAEHVPGCNMAFYRRALEEIAGFDPVFRRAGDDVDVCWRLQQRGYRLAFSAGGFVWHYRRSTVRAYLRQQRGYGEAEALLARKHPEFFNRVGSGRWRGRIYGTDAWGLALQPSVIYHGQFGGALFQRLYAPPASSVLALGASLEYLALVALPAVVLALWIPAVWLAALPLLSLPLTVGLVAAVRANLPASQRRWWSRPLVGLLFLLQPIARGLARYRARLALTPAGRPPVVTAEDLPLVSLRESNTTLAFWSASAVGRENLLRTMVVEAERHGFQVRQDTGWHSFDLELVGDAWGRFQLVTAREELERGENNVRFRLTARWSVLANLAFFGSGMLVALVIWLMAEREPWIWLLPAVLPVALWAIEARHLITASIIAGLVRTVADQRGMKPLCSEGEAD
jgi:GT2 family glycosyltransferase